MHFNNLVTVKDIAPVPKETPILEMYLDSCIAIKLEALFSLFEKDPKNFMIGIKIGECNQVRNQFSREIFMKIADIMEPTCECTENPLYLAFYNVEEEYKKDFCTKKEDCVKYADGRIRPLPHWDFEIKDGLVYQKHAGPLKNSKRTKKAKRMTAMPDYPLNKAFKSLGEYLEYLGYEYDDKHQAYGRYANPNGYWDWYALGGRWPAAFLVPESCHEYGVGNIECKDSERLKAPPGYQWVAMARKKISTGNLCIENDSNGRWSDFEPCANVFVSRSCQQGLSDESPMTVSQGLMIWYILTVNLCTRILCEEAS